MTCFVRRLADPHATGLCGDVLLEIGIIEYGLASSVISVMMFQLQFQLQLFFQILFLFDFFAYLA